MQSLRPKKSTKPVPKLTLTWACWNDLCSAAVLQKNIVLKISSDPYPVAFMDKSKSLYRLSTQY